MLRRMENKGTFVVKSFSGQLYMVTITRLKNNAYGNPRYEANIIKFDDVQEESLIYIPTYVYRFDGYYLSDYDEAHWLINEHERRLNG